MAYWRNWIAAASLSLAIFMVWGFESLIGHI